MPLAGKSERRPVRSRGRGRGAERSPGRELALPVIGMEAEFNVVLDGVEIDPRAYWGHPLAFIEGSLLPRQKSSFHLPTGGAVYFDRGVIEVVTPVIEVGPGSTARVVRNLWEGIGFVRAELTKWEGRHGHRVSLKGYSAHYNVSFELPAAQQTPTRNIKTLALLLAHILPFPVALAGTNRRSTGVGVRPRGNRVEITVDFTPDPALMIATATLIVGVVREVLGWPSYDLALLDTLPIPTVDGIVPGKHTTRKGWLTKDHQYAQSPYTCDVDAPLWTVRGGRVLSLRAIAREVAWHFRASIRRHADPFSFRLLFALFEGRSRTLLDLQDRPAAYEDVGHLCAWGKVIDELKRRPRRRPLAGAPAALPPRPAAEAPAAPPKRTPEPPFAGALLLLADAVLATPLRSRPLSADGPTALPMAASPAAAPAAVPSPARVTWSRAPERRRADRRQHVQAVPFPDRRLSRSAYEKVFLKLVSGGRLRIGRQTWTPVGMRGWYHAIFRNDVNGRERLITIDQLLAKMADWEP
jgi:hypothetical protein